MSEGLHYFVGFNTGLNPITQPIISLYRNPANNILHIAGLIENNLYRIYNMLGVEVSTGYSNGNSLYVADLPKGVYLLQIQTKSSVLQSRFVKK
ncbi:MAG: T9SS type A sorting domain-containing protein [Bacteroidia bacterium]|nr:T9SS type A sorting domain-containing protein [Bacteroidia bacterium]